VGKTLVGLIVASCLWTFGCQDSSKIYPIEFVDRKEFFPAADAIQKPKPLLLVVAVAADGRLSLNRIETGKISDVKVLKEKIAVVFADREKSLISEREVVIDPQVGIDDEDLGKLIEALKSVDATPIRIIKNNL